MSSRKANDVPLEEIHTDLEWKDLDVSDMVREEIQEIRTWVNHEKSITKSWDLSKKVRPGFRALFYGSSGTSKTLSAALLGKELGKKVFRVDLSVLVSKYVGETEKNLGQLFSEAEEGRWILFFDEADALFGKRVEVKSANDRYANQEISYLLQRIEDFVGLVILSINSKEYVGEAFVRRFNSIINFTK